MADDLALRLIDEGHEFGEPGRVGAPVEAGDDQPREVPALGARPAGVGRREVFGQEVGLGGALDTEHEVVPGEVVVAEVDPAEVGHIVGDDHLLVVAGRIAGEPRAQGVGDADPDALAGEAAEHSGGLAHFGAVGGIKPGGRREHPAIADHQARVVVRQHSAVSRAARADRLGGGQSDGVALEGHRLDQNPPFRRRDVAAGPPPEGVGAGQPLEPAQTRPASGETCPRRPTAARSRWRRFGLGGGRA